MFINVIKHSFQETHEPLNLTYLPDTPSPHCPSILGQPKLIPAAEVASLWPPHKHTLLQHPTHLNHLSDKAYMNDLPRCRLQAKCTVFPPSPEGWSFLISPQSLGSCCENILYYIIFPLHSSPSDFSIFTGKERISATFVSSQADL